RSSFHRSVDHFVLELLGMSATVRIEMQHSVIPIDLAALLLVAGEEGHRKPAISLDVDIGDSSPAWLYQKPRTYERWVELAAALHRRCAWRRTGWSSRRGRRCVLRDGRTSSTGRQV